MNDRTISTRSLFAVVYTTSLVAVYVALGVIIDRALGLTPVVFLAAGVMFVLTTMTYVEASGLHPEPGGSTVFSRYAFNELWSFVSGWAICLDYLILTAVTALAAANYAGRFWSPLATGVPEVLVAAAIIAYAALRNVRGLTGKRLQWRARIAWADLSLQVLVVVLGVLLVLDPGAIVDSIELGTSPRWEDVLFALTVATVCFAGLEAAASLSGEVQTTRRKLRRFVGAGTATIIAVYFLIGVVAASVLVDPSARVGREEWIDAPLLALVSGFGSSDAEEGLELLVAAFAIVVLIAGCVSSMLGLSRTAYALATNRQIPSLVGRLQPQRGTPYIAIGLAALIAVGLAIPADIELLVGIYAFGATLAFVIAHASVIRLRYTEPDRRRPYRIPLGVRIGGGSLPVPAVLGLAVTAAAGVGLLAIDDGARYVGLSWMLAGLALYVSYRRIEGNPVFERRTVPEAALRTHLEDIESRYGSILVPVFGNELDVDIVQTAGRLAGEPDDDESDEGLATIEAVWIDEIPLALPLDARLPDDRRRQAREALARAKAVGEEYDGVKVEVSRVRSRRAGQAIVEQARRLGVEAIVLAAEPPSRIVSGARLGASGPLDDYVGDITKYVLRKAPCRVILTAPAAPLADPPTPAPDPAESR